MTALKDVLDRAKSWPAAAQEELMRAALIIERNQDSGFELNAADWALLDQRLAAAGRGDVKTDAEAEAVFGKYRQA